ncbi:retropepsin-like aspartic protease family protein [Microbaculum sp. FT89]|uniref:retropepsin-like aspartic protease family protein n=1 Tax=Microbaculum sp. FT89 TaxID=3447298 RepID=UPI003F53A012
MRGLAILFVLGAAVYAAPKLEQYVSQSENPDAGRDESANSSTYATAPLTVRLRADPRGHFLVQATVNGRTIDMLADTGASAVALTEADARRAGFDPRTLDFNIPVQTANGKVNVASVMLDRIEVEGIVLRDVRAMVAENDALASSLLGMSFLGRLASVKLSGDTLELVK